MYKVKINNTQRTKAFMLEVETGDLPSNLIDVSSSLDALFPDYLNELNRAVVLSRRDGLVRRVRVTQILLEGDVVPVKPRSPR